MSLGFDVYSRRVRRHAAQHRPVHHQHPRRPACASATPSPKPTASTSASRSNRPASRCSPTVRSASSTSWTSSATTPLSVNATLGWTRDRRDSAIWTTSGYTARAAGEVALPIADLQYYKLTVGSSVVVSAHPGPHLLRQRRTRLRRRLRRQAAAVLQELTTPAASTSVRGYQHELTGPQDINGVLGGSNRAVGQPELLFPMPGLDQDRSRAPGRFLRCGPGVVAGELRRSDASRLYAAGGAIPVLYGRRVPLELAVRPARAWCWRSRSIPRMATGSSGSSSSWDRRSNRPCGDLT